jgi:hypothetical protein
MPGSFVTQLYSAQPVGILLDMTLPGSFVTQLYSAQPVGILLDMMRPGSILRLPAFAHWLLAGGPENTHKQYCLIHDLL